MTGVSELMGTTFITAPYSQLLLFGLFQMVCSNPSLLILNVPCLVLFWLFPQERQLLALQPLVFYAVEKLL